MIGFPDETEEDINMTVNLMKKIKPFTSVLSIFTLEYGLIPKEIDWSRFFHQSPDMYFVKNIEKNRFRQIIKTTEDIFDKHNKSQRRTLVIRRPLYIIRRIIKNKYYNPKNIPALIRMIK